MWCHYCDKSNLNTADCKAIMRAKQHKKAQSEAKAAPGKKDLAFLFEETNAIKKHLNPPRKGKNPQKRKAESLLSTEIDLTNSSDEDEEYFALPSAISNTSNKLVKASHPTSELIVSLNVNYEEHVLRVLADTDASSSIILEACAPKNLIRYDEETKSTWSTMGGQFTADKTGLVTFSLPEFNFKKQISRVFHVDDRSKASSIYHMIIG
jgi:hypothetical protein